MNSGPANNPGLPAHRTGTAQEVFFAFLPLGFTAFGGPIAHLGYFRTAFVEKRRWIDDAAFADLVALCQFLPGPASSQVGMALGLQRAGALGMLAAWVAFTLPSAIVMAAFGLAVAAVDVLAASGWLLGLKAAAVAVVAQALLGMASSLAATRATATIAAAAAIAILVSPDPIVAMLCAIASAGLLGLFLDVDDARPGPSKPPPVSRTVGAICLIGFMVLLVGLPFAAQLSPAADLFDRIYRAGSLVFGGGHVVLPLLEGDRVFTAHNLDFDYAFLRTEYKRLGIRFYKPPLQKLCTVILSRMLLADLPSRSLPNLIKHFNFDISTSHRAEADTKACWLLAKLLLTQIQNEDDEVLLKRFGQQWIRLQDAAKILNCRKEDAQKKLEQAAVESRLSFKRKLPMYRRWGVEQFYYQQQGQQMSLL